MGRLPKLKGDQPGQRKIATFFGGQHPPDTDPENPEPADSDPEPEPPVPPGPDQNPSDDDGNEESGSAPPTGTGNDPVPDYDIDMFDPVGFELANPPAKRPRADDFSDEERMVVNHYLKMFEWLVVPGPGSVLCSECRDYQRQHKPGKPTQWSSGKPMEPAKTAKVNVGHWCSNTFRMHEVGKEHRTAVSTPKLQPTATLQFAVQNQYRGKNQATKRAMATVLFTVQEEMPIRKAEKLHEFIVTLSTGDSEDTGSPGNLMLAAHKSNWSTYRFIIALNHDVSNRQLDRLRNCVAYTIHADESTDISERAFLLLYVQYVTLDEQGNHTVHPCEFLTVVKIPDGKAETIARKILDYLNYHKIALEKMVMFTSDGAAVMVGRHSGVAARLREVVGPHLIDYHCVSHREALAMSHAYQAFKPWQSLDADLRSLIAYLGHGKQRGGLEALCAALEMEYVEIPRIIDIRWLSRAKAVKAIIRDYSTIVKFLETQSTRPDVFEVDRAQALGFLNQLKSLQKVWMLHRLGDLLEPFEFLMTVSQKRGMHPYRIKQQTEAVIETLKCRYKFDPETDKPRCWDGDNILKLVDVTAVLVPNDPPDDWPVATERADRLVVKLALKLIEELELRCGAQTESAILKDTQLFDTQFLKRFTGPDHAYGNIELTALYSRYCHVVDLDLPALKVEWRYIISFYKHQNLRKTPDWHELLDEITMSKTGDAFQYPNVRKLALIILAFNAQNAEVERGFSLSNRLKTKLRNRLSPGILDVLMRLTLIAEQWYRYHDDYNTAVDIWAGTAIRGRYGAGQKVGAPLWRQQKKSGGSQQPGTSQQQSFAEGPTDQLELDEASGLDLDDQLSLESFVREGGLSQSQ